MTSLIVYYLNLSVAEGNKQTVKNGQLKGMKKKTKKKHDIKTVSKTPQRNPIALVENKST